MSSIAEAVAAGELPGRVWFYSNYHCNLQCTYCLTESAPSSPRRTIGPDQVLRLALQAADLGFTDLGVTGGEPFLLPYLVDMVKEMSEILPTMVLSNGTLFGPRRLARAKELAGHDVAIQISLDAPEPDLNDEMRGPENFAKVTEAIPELVDAGVKVRIATTVEPDRLDMEQHARLCALHRSWGISDEDHVVRPIITRGRAIGEGLGVEFDHHRLPVELTVTADGTFWSPFGPTMDNGRPDTDLMITRTIEPLWVPALALLRLARGRAEATGVELGIRWA